MTISIINHKRLLELLDAVDNPQQLLRHLPTWMTLQRLEALLEDYRYGVLNDLQIAELDAVLEIVPALENRYHKSI
jgi:hypothetical protein